MLVGDRVFAFMGHSQQQKEQALFLRATTEMTLADIARQLGISKSTLYYWVRDLPVATNSNTRPTTEVQRTNQQAATAAMQAKYAARREDAYAVTYSEADLLLADVEIRDFVVLYLAEGLRKSRNTVSLGNQPSNDPLR